MKREKNNKIETISNVFEDKEIRSVQDIEKQGSEVTTNCSQFKMLALDGKKRLRDAITTRDILRLIEFVPNKGYSDEWIKSRL